MPRRTFFICYAHADLRKYVLPLQRALERAGFSAWVAEGEIKPGQNIIERIQTAIRGSRYAIPIITPQSLHRSFPRRELQLFIKRMFETGRDCIVPLCDADFAEVLDAFPMLANTQLTAWSDGLPKIMEGIRAKLIEDRQVYESYTDAVEPVPVSTNIQIEAIQYGYPSLERTPTMINRTIDKFRFYIRDEADRQRSSVWFAHHDGDDVYISVGMLGGHMKLSLHRDRNCQFGMVRRYAEKLAAGGLTAMRPTRWMRPVTPQEGAFHAASVFFPTDFLRSTGEMQRSHKLKFSLPMAPAGQAIEVGFFYSREAPESLEDRFIARLATPILYMNLPSGEFVSAVARPVLFDPKQIADLQTAGPKAQPLDGAPAPGGRMENVHAILFDDHTDPARAFRIIEVNGLSVARCASNR